MKRIFSIITSVALFICTLGISITNIDSVTVKAETDWPNAPAIYGTAGCLIEASTGTVLYEKKAHQQMYPASITKILTALVTLENAELDEPVTFSEEAVYSLVAGDANMAMSVGEILPVEDCLYGLMLKSANEVATALAEHVGGSVEGFAQMMNERAKQAGATNSNFMNANGLHNDNHYITAYDMAMITRAAVQNPVYLSITGTTEYTVSKSNMKDAFTIYQRHQMTRLTTGYYYEGILGGKTGYTDQSGTTLVTYAERNGMTLIAVVLQSNGVNVYNDTATLLDYGFENFHKVNISENETRFNATSDHYTDYLTPAFGSLSTSTIKLDNSDYIVIPKNASFEDVTSNIVYGNSNEGTTYEIKPNEIAKITYNYGERAVGSVSVVFDDIVDDTDSIAVNSPVVNANNNAEDNNNNENNANVDDTNVEDKSNIISADDKDTNGKDTNNKDIDNKENVNQDKSNTDDAKDSKSSDSFIKTLITILLNLIVVIIIILFIRKKHRELNELRASKRRRRY